MQLSRKTSSEYGVRISKQGIDKRFNEEAVKFVKTVFETYLKLQIDQNGFETGWLKHFNYVRIKDGTRFNIPEEFSDHFAGSGGSASKAGICIQYEYDIKSGKILDLKITEANKPDIIDAKETMDNITKNDLIIRDLGYYNIKILDNTIKKEAYFISRNNTSTAIFEKKRNGFEPIDFKELHRFMVANKLTRIEKVAYIGAKRFLPVRLIIDLMPEEVFKKRIRVNNKGNKKKGYKTSDQYRNRAKFNLFITNIEEDKMPKEAIPTIYKIRWQVELIFKIWKSNFSINKLRDMKYERWLCVLYVKLLAIVINWEIITFHMIKFYYKYGKLLSINKANKMLLENFDKIRLIIRHTYEKLSLLIDWITEELSKYHWVEGKKNAISIEKILFQSYESYN